VKEKYFQLVEKLATKFWKGALSAAKAPFGPPPPSRPATERHFSCLHFSQDDRVLRILPAPAIDPMPMIRMLIVSYVFAIWWRAAKLKATGAFLFK